MILLPIFFSGCEVQSDTKKAKAKTPTKKEKPSNPRNLQKSVVARDSEVAVVSTQFGDMVVEFYDRAAPKHVESFKLHVKSGYYNGTIFHRVIPGFMIQGGDPNTKGNKKSTYGQGGNSAKYYGIGLEDKPKTWNIPAEFNNIKHTRGILSMARSNDKNSAGSQFFICDADASHLDAQYTVFGKVVEGFEIIDRIVNLPRDDRNNPLNRVEMKIRLEKPNI